MAATVAMVAMAVVTAVVTAAAVVIDTVRYTVRKPSFQCSECHILRKQVMIYQYKRSLLIEPQSLKWPSRSIP